MQLWNNDRTLYFLWCIQSWWFSLSDCSYQELSIPLKLIPGGAAAHRRENREEDCSPQTEGSWRMLGLQSLRSRPHPVFRKVWVIQMRLCQHAMYNPTRKTLFDTAECQESLNHKLLSWDLGSLC